MKLRAYALLVIIFLALAATVYSLQLRIDISRDERAAVEEFMYLPRADYLKVASLGYEQLVADLLWLKAVQHIGERNISARGYDWIYTALDTVTTLDPKFTAPYEVGGLMLTLLADKVDLSNKLLEKAVKNNPEVWQFQFYLGFNYFYFLKDYKTAARYMETASKIPGSPSYLPLLTSRLYVQAEDPVYSLQFLLRMYDNTKDEGLRANILGRINVLKAVVTARALQEIVDAYKKRFGHVPHSLGELVRLGALKGIPEEPNGGYYYIDPRGTVRSSKVKENLGIYTRK